MNRDINSLRRELSAAELAAALREYGTGPQTLGEWNNLMNCFARFESMLSADDVDRAFHAMAAVVDCYHSRDRG